MTDEALDVGEIIDNSPVGSIQRVVIGLCACLIFLDGFDAQAIGYVAPVLIRTWPISPRQLGWVFSAGLIGLMLGSLTIAPLADRFGRRPIMLVSTFSFGLFSLLTANATTVNALWLLRFLTGLGLGGLLPNTISLTAEYSPQRRRSLLVMTIATGFTAGSLFAGLVSAQLISRYGWQAVFMVGGVLPLLAVVVVFFALPESIHFLVANRGEWRMIARLLHKIDRSIQVQETQRYRVTAQLTARMSVALLLREGRGRNTILLWIIFFMSFLDIYFLVNWLPAAMNASGASIKTAINVGTMLQVGGLLGPLLLGWLVGRRGPRLALVPAYLLGALCISCVGVYARSDIPLTVLMVFGAGFGVLGGHTAANAVAASSYPASIRSTGIGWALGIGRIGSIIGPAIAGVLIGNNVSIQKLFLLASIPAVCVAAAALGMAPFAAAAGAKQWGR
jgi:AAHS family 4-hydroxybenzoate transporter-like MFS transporter